MNFQIIEAEQRSPEWFKARAGLMTGSVAADMLATIKSGEAAARRDLRTRLVCERLTGLPQEDGFVNAAMQRGIEMEPLAFAAYEALTGSVAVRTGFLRHNTLPIGCSLDGHVDGFKGIVEIKCPKSATHLKYWRGKGEVPSDYIPQITHNLFVTGAEWCDFLSFDDRFPVEMQTFLYRVQASELDMAAYEAALMKFLGEIDTEVDAIRTMNKGWAA